MVFDVESFAFLSHSDIQFGVQEIEIDLTGTTPINALTNAM